MSSKGKHWADVHAERVARQKGEKNEYVCASGITPSGTIHIGNFREIMSVDLVYRALKDSGKNAKFIYSWDDYDVFRKVPKNVPNPEEMEQYLRMPITSIPDPWGNEESYARANEKVLEDLLPKVGIQPEYIYQAKQYAKATYAEGIKTALENKEIIKEALNRHRTNPLAEDWWPVSVFCTSCKKDTTEVTGWDGQWGVSYTCTSCKNEETLDLRETGAVKLPWRIDWPMRWKHEGVDFEPAGKDHHSEGGSFDTAKEIVKRVYDYQAPATFQYDFISIKGRGGKISSSSGEVVSLGDVLEIYQPEVTRYLFAGTKPNSEFAISFDLDVIKIYEDYDKCERIYFGAQDVGEKKREKESRIYELSQIDGIPEKMPYQLPFRHLCNLLQIHDGDTDGVIASLGDVEPEQVPALTVRAKCAWNWITQFAPEDFKYQLKKAGAEPEEFSAKEKAALAALYHEVAGGLETHDERSFAEAVYRIAQEGGFEPKDFFPVVYRALIGKERGPRLAGFIMTAGKERIAGILRPYAE